MTLFCFLQRKTPYETGHHDAAWRFKREPNHEMGFHDTNCPPIWEIVS